MSSCLQSTLSSLKPGFLCGGLAIKTLCQKCFSFFSKLCNRVFSLSKRPPMLFASCKLLLIAYQEGSCEQEEVSGQTLKGALTHLVGGARRESEEQGVKEEFRACKAGKEGLLRLRHIVALFHQFYLPKHAENAIKCEI